MASASVPASRLLPYVPVYWHTKEFHNSLEWSVAKIYLPGDKLTERVSIHSSLHALGTVTKSRSQEACSCFMSAFIEHETMPKVGWYLKSYWLKEFPQHLSLLSK